MRILSSFLLLSIALTLTSCGGGGGGGKGGGDSDEKNDECPTMGVDKGEGLLGACCWRKSNRDRKESPEFRLSGLALAAPTAVANETINGLLRLDLDQEIFNWLIRFNDLDGANPSYTTGFGELNSDNTFSFREEGDRFHPTTVSGTLSGESFTAGAADGLIIVPVIDLETGKATLEFALTNLALDSLTFSHERSCVGVRDGKNFTTMDGQLSAYITVDTAKTARVSVKGIVEASLCHILAGYFTPAFDEENDCKQPQADWKSPPDALCTGSTCEQDPGDGSVCAPADCNAWFLKAGFSAQGVDITDDTVAGDDGGDDDAGDGG